MQTWIDILTDPHHVLADLIMNIGFEVMFAWITTLITLKIIAKNGKGKHRK
jgi:hypothetical protein